MVSRIGFSGPARYRLRSAAELSQSITEVSARRLLKGPLRPSWNWFVEVMTRMMRKRVVTALAMPDVAEARLYLDSIEVTSSALSQVKITPVIEDAFRGSWYTPTADAPQRTVLYLHGGGYSYYPRAYANVIAQFALAAKSHTFALDYRLTPEHPFPAQLEDALHAYRWLLESGLDTNQLVIAGDSAGGNLALALLLKLRDLRLAPPALAIALSPPTNFEADITGNEEFDWITQPALLRWRDWFCQPSQRCNPLVSPVRADLCRLPPIYVQAGRAEILYPSIQAFADRAQAQKADITLETWEDMNHNFQVFGPDAPQSTEAWHRIAEVIDARLQQQQATGAPAAANR